MIYSYLAVSMQEAVTGTVAKLHTGIEEICNYTFIKYDYGEQM
jgi:hypothetical protein